MKRLAAWSWLLASACIALCTSPPTAYGHALAPILVRVDELREGHVQVRWTLSTAGSGLGLTAGGDPFTLRLPAHCQPSDDVVTRDGVRLRTTVERFRCATTLAGETLVIERLALGRQPVVLRYRGPHGVQVARTLAGSDDRLTLPEAGAAPAGVWAAFARYVRIGVEHILAGWDHLAFVLCLAVVAGSVRRLLWAVTSFTVAHSVTLALASLEWVRLPGPPVEACIALSVLFVAARALSPRAAPSLWGLCGTAFAFGLLHGLGFAGALSEVGFESGSLAVCLLGFNLGVELGQLGVLLLLVACERLLAWGLRSPLHVARARGAAVELAGIAAGYWLVERVLSFTAA